ncbi:halocyanin domain-containing protein [Halorientalis sp.]|uniref:halocyanin domain-containing protein n=1 Tax=Halorientalis sp. TaxID=1931229 RepID=UPI002633860D|nr:halocyanin domain-containing protein [Halorientalis sp.]
MTFALEESDDDAAVTALHVLDVIEAGYGAPMEASLPGRWENWHESEKENAEQLFADGHGVTLEAATTRGRPARSIVEYADTEAVDRVVRRSRGRSGVSRILLGSVAEAVLRRAPCPVTIVRRVTRLDSTKWCGMDSQPLLRLVGLILDGEKSRHMETERSNESDGAASRRGFLRTAATAGAAAGVAAGATGTATAQDGTEMGSNGPSFDGWLADTTNYDGEVVDMTGQDAVTIAVGGDGLVFDPPAVQVDPGTTITWEWQGGRHNVVGENRDFDSGDPVSETGATFEQTLEEDGVVKYLCEPHQGVMQGVVVVGDAALGGEEEGGEIVLTDGLLAIGAAIVLGVLSPMLFAVYLALNGEEVGGDDDDSSSGDSDLKRIDP